MRNWNKCHWVKLFTTQDNSWNQTELAEARAASLLTETEAELENGRSEWVEWYTSRHISLARGFQLLAAHFSTTSFL